MTTTSPTTTQPPRATAHRVRAAHAAFTAAARSALPAGLAKTLEDHVDGAKLLTPAGDVDVDHVTELVAYFAALTRTADPAALAAPTDPA